MMSDTLSHSAKLARQLVAQKLTSWRDGKYPLLNSTWPVFERLLDRHAEMSPVYHELAERQVTGDRLWLFLEQCVLAGGFGTDERYTQLRADYKTLVALNEEISESSLKLATLLSQRTELIAKSGQFHHDHMHRLTDMIDAAGSENYLYRFHVHPQLQQLNEFGLKYWPKVEDILHVISQDNPEIEFADSSTEAIVKTKRGSLTDFFRELFDRLNDLKEATYFRLPRNFRLSDGALATLCNVIRDLPVTNMVDAVYVKSTRQRLKNQGLIATW